MKIENENATGTESSEATAGKPLADATSSVLDPRRIEGVLIPADHTFEAINAFVHHTEVSYEELQGAILGMAAKCEKLTTALRNISSLPMKAQDNMVSANMRSIASAALFPEPNTQGEPAATGTTKQEGTSK